MRWRSFTTAAAVQRPWLHPEPVSFFGNARDVRWYGGQERRRSRGRRKSDH
jgi:hypothetical protein